MPDDYEKYLGFAAYVPVLQLDQESKALVHEISTLPSQRSRYREILMNRGMTSCRRLFFEGMVRYDSGHPCFLLEGNNLIFLYDVQGTQTWNYGAAAGYHVAWFKREIQAAMDQLSDRLGFPRESLSIKDISAYDELVNWREDD